MSDPFVFSHPKPVDPSAPRAPNGWTWIAGVIILALASYGLYRGVTEVRNGDTGLLPTSRAGIVAPVDAASAAPLPHDDQWSTLSGPKVLPPPPPPAPKTAKPADTDDSADDSSAPDKTAADNSDDSQDDAVAPPPVKAKKAARPPPDEDAPPDTAPTPPPADQ